MNQPLFERIKTVYDRRKTLGLTREQMRLPEKTYKGFVRNGATLGDSGRLGVTHLSDFPYENAEAPKKAHRMPCVLHTAA